MEAGIENVRVAKSLADLKCYVHPKTVESMVEYCAEVHKRDEKKMLTTMVSSYNIRQSNSKKGSDIRWIQEQIEWLQNNEFMKSSGKYKTVEDIIGSDGKSVRAQHRQWNECKTWRKETSTDGRITVVADRKDSLVKSLLDKYANYKKSLN
eukprot:scaffold2313_cov103-Alexandrium_tamarense.AAC.1